MFVRWYSTHFVFNVFAIYIGLVCKNGVAPQKIAVASNGCTSVGVQILVEVLKKYLFVAS